MNLRRRKESTRKWKYFPCSLGAAKPFFIVIWDSKRKGKIFLIIFQVFNIASLSNETKCGENFLLRCGNKKIFCGEALVHKLRRSITAGKLFVADLRDINEHLFKCHNFVLTWKGGERYKYSGNIALLFTWTSGQACSQGISGWQVWNKLFQNCYGFCHFLLWNTLSPILPDRQSSSGISLLGQKLPPALPKLPKLLWQIMEHSTNQKHL